MKTITITNSQIICDTIDKCGICFVGITQPDGMPYVIPMCFGFHDNTFYFHSGLEGDKLDFLKNNPRVCITLSEGEQLVFQHSDVACSYSMKSHSIIAQGEVAFIDDYDEKVKALDIIMQHYTKRKFTYGIPAVNNVRIWKVSNPEISCKSFGNRAKRQ